jgi:NAD(P)-dependent dehydrogenase (short-subunit alcohol dehydrogenase family)
LAVAGFRVGLVARDEARLTEVADALGDRAVVAIADVTDAEQVAAAVAKVEQSFGPIDLLVNNAGIADTDELPVWESDPTQWWRVVETNLRGPYLFSRAVLPGLRDRGGRIVNITGMVDHAVPGYSSYCVAKAALARLTESLAQDGVRAFDVAPGLIRTELTTAMPMLRDAPADTYGSTERLVDFVLAIAAGRLDRLAGRYFHAQRDRLDDLEAGLDGRRLRMTAG